ncbi:MAG TPA: carbon-nitrogen hydrolase family protein [Alphaproteobacteria bacterium]|nr:carbon-nitrogen hydrolase family protein [Alphaproteobacteria bacterium]
MSGKFTVACVQTNSTRDVAENLSAIVPMIGEARRRGATLVCLPEVVGMIEPRRRLLLEKVETEETNRGLAGFRETAKRLSLWLLVGSLSVKVGPDRVANRSYLIDQDGAVRASYDKIHMFDVSLEGGESYRESATFRAGETAMLADTPWGPLGMTVCYDLRFPQLYRALAQAGAMYLTIPAAFTRPTGRAHWQVLVRARAIETGCFVFAAAQCGEHAEGRRTYGHSLIVAPWGEILAEAGEEVGVITAEIDPAKVDEARRMVPSLQHDRPFSPPASIPRATIRRAAGE